MDFMLYVSMYHVLQYADEILHFVIISYYLLNYT